ncbi:hypothetical protein LDL59_02330 [Kaistella anthropi]|nr:hypothetical protein [Kaistella anthropi]
MNSVNNNFAVSTTNLKYAHNNFGTGREYYVVAGRFRRQNWWRSWRYQRVG